MNAREPRSTIRGPLLRTRRGGPGPAVLALVLLAAAPAAGERPKVPSHQGVKTQEAIDYCLSCHDDATLTLPLQNGETMSLQVKPDALARSVHARDLICTDCHQGYDNGDKHPGDATFQSRRQYVQRSYEVCRQCHFETYTRTLESIHFKLLEKGRTDVPVCTDCHGAHDIQDPKDKSAMISRSCGECHPKVLEQYVQSVHGKALVQDRVNGVPGCTDCHTAHSIADPRTASFRLGSPEICIGCHANEKKMKPFNLSPDVASTYLADFHGVTATLADPKKVTERHLVVTCVDCHGVHDIASPELIGKAAMTQRVQHVCASCHKDAGESLPAAWLSHFRPSLKHAPLVFLINAFYAVFIPFSVFGLGLQVLLHLYRVAVRR